MIEPRLHENEVPFYYRSLDFEALWRDYPPAPGYLETAYRLSRDELHALQNERFLRQMTRGWEIAFYKRHWSKAGIRPGDIRSLEDLEQHPGVLRARHARGHRAEPAVGRLDRHRPRTDEPMPSSFQTSGGTTGLPRPMLYTPHDREVMNINTGRRMYMQGVRPFDLVQVSLATGLPNGGVLAREGIWKYTGAVPITGRRQPDPVATPGRADERLGRNFFAAFRPLSAHMALVARDELRFDLRELEAQGARRPWLGLDDRKPLEDSGARTFTTNMASTTAARSAATASTEPECMCSKMRSSWN